MAFLSLDQVFQVCLHVLAQIKAVLTECLFSHSGQATSRDYHQFLLMFMKIINIFCLKSQIGLKNEPQLQATVPDLHVRLSELTGTRFGEELVCIQFVKFSSIVV